MLEFIIHINVSELYSEYFIRIGKLKFRFQCQPKKTLVQILQKCTTSLSLKWIKFPSSNFIDHAILEKSPTKQCHFPPYLRYSSFLINRAISLLSLCCSHASCAIFTTWKHFQSWIILENHTKSSLSGTMCDFLIDAFLTKLIG